MQEAFLIIISLIGAIYALTIKQGKTALGLIALAISFVFQIPNLVTGFWTNFLLALSLILFALGILILVFKKKDVSILNAKDEKENSKIE